MSLEDRFAQHDKEIVDKFVNPAADYEMSVRDYVVRPAADHNTGPITVTLPPVAEAKGRFYSIVCRNADPVNLVTIADRDDSECWLGDIAMNGKCDRLLAYSDGLCWLCAFSTSWPGARTTTPPGTDSPTTVAPTTVVPD